MAETKGELRIYKGFEKLYLYSTSSGIRIADIPDTGAITKEECIANAARMKLCWNSHDDLVAACRELVKFCESKERYKPDYVCPVKAYELAKVGIAKGG